MTDYQRAITHCDNCGCDWLDNGLNPVGCPYCKQGPALEWSKTLLGGRRVTYKQAEKAVADLGDGWRLPTRQELESLLDMSRYDPAIDVEKYPDTKSLAYWTSTPYAWNRCRERWVINFYNGNVYTADRTSVACVRAVRSL